MPKSKKKDPEVEDELVDPLPDKLRHAVVSKQLSIQPLTALHDADNSFPMVISIAVHGRLPDIWQWNWRRTILSDVTFWLILGMYLVFIWYYSKWLTVAIIVLSQIAHDWEWLKFPVTQNGSNFLLLKMAHGCYYSINQYGSWLRMAQIFYYLEWLKFPITQNYSEWFMAAIA